MSILATETRELTSNELGAVLGGAPSCAQFDFLGVHFNFEWDNTVKTTWWDGRQTWLGWGK
jgi:hypothetical protein